jgi:hypothetical protein
MRVTLKIVKQNHGSYYKTVDICNYLIGFIII